MRARRDSNDSTSEAAQSGTDCEEVARYGCHAKCGPASGGGVADLGGERRDVPSLAGPVWRDEVRRSQAAEGAGGEEPALEADRGGPGFRHSDVEVPDVNKLVIPSAKRAAVSEVQQQFEVSERR